MLRLQNPSRRCEAYLERPDRVKTTSFKWRVVVSSVFHPKGCLPKCAVARERMGECSADRDARMKSGKRTAALTKGH